MTLEVYIPQLRVPDRSGNLSSALSCLTFYRIFWLNQADQTQLQGNRELQKHQKWAKAQIPLEITCTWPSNLSDTSKQTWFCLTLCHRTRALEKPHLEASWSLKTHLFYHCAIKKHWRDLHHRQTQINFQTYANVNHQ